MAKQAIYVMEGVDRTKVGISKSPKSRRGQLRAESPDLTLTLIYSAFPGEDKAIQLERLTHKLLSDHRILGEYFSVDGKTAVNAVLKAAMELGFTLTEHEDQRCVLLIRVQPWVKEAIAQAALEEQRSVSNLIERVMTEWLREHYVPGKKTAAEYRAEAFALARLDEAKRKK